MLNRLFSRSNKKKPVEHINPKSLSSLDIANAILLKGPSILSGYCGGDINLIFDTENVKMHTSTRDAELLANLISTEISLQQYFNSDLNTRNIIVVMIFEQLVRIGWKDKFKTIHAPWTQIYQLGEFGIPADQALLRRELASTFQTIRDILNGNAFNVDSTNKLSLLGIRDLLKSLKLDQHSNSSDENQIQQRRV